MAEFLIDLTVTLRATGDDIDDATESAVDAIRRGTQMPSDVEGVRVDDHYTQVAP